MELMREIDNCIYPKSPYECITSFSTIDKKVHRVSTPKGEVILQWRGTGVAVFWPNNLRKVLFYTLNWQLRNWLDNPDVIYLGVIE